ncbi:MAG: arsenate reductase ArsC [Desulfobacter sp.]|nr:arsenate reductase ArsC [Desulfobacter sp.]WDP85125.1 MAG: arsenate reductase ArsC [Desulfobacter sp.]
MGKKLKFLFLCTGNSCRSQMAEGWGRALKHDVLEVYSAGVETHGLNPEAVKVMAEAGIDISGHRSKVVHAGFDDPPRMAQELAYKGESAKVQLDCYRTIRDEIKAFVEKMPDNII